MSGAYSHGPGARPALVCGTGLLRQTSRSRQCRQAAGSEIGRSEQARADAWRSSRVRGHASPDFRHDRVCLGEVPRGVDLGHVGLGMSQHGILVVANHSISAYLNPVATASR